MRTDITEGFYTEEDISRLKALSEEAEETGVCGEMMAFSANMVAQRAIFTEIDRRYIEDRAGNEALILEDVKTILSRAEKKDYTDFLATYIEPVKDEDIPILQENLKNEAVQEKVKAAAAKRKGEAPKECYEDCYEFFAAWLWLPLAAAVRTYDDEEKIEKLRNKIIVLLDNRIQEWYPKPIKDFLPIYDGRPVGAMAYLDTTRHKKSIDKISNISTYSVDGVELTTKVVIKSSVNVAKIFLFLISEFTANSDNFSINNTEIRASVADFARYCGKDLTKHITDDEAAEAKRVKMARDNLVKEVKKSLQSLFDLSYSIEGEGLVAKTRIISNYVVKGDNIAVNLVPELADHLSKKAHTITQLPTAIFKVPATDPNALHFIYKLSFHYNMDSNIKRGTNDFISVRSLLEVAELPSFEEIQQKDRGHWERRIKEPFEEILERLYSKYGFLSYWEYRHENRAAVTDKDLANLKDFEEWKAHYYILFEPVKKVDHSARIERKEARIEKKKTRKKQAEKK